MNQTIEKMTNTKKEEISAKKLRSIAVVLGSIAFFAICMQGFLSFALPTRAEMTDTPSELRNAKGTNALFDEVSLEAHAAYVLELNTGMVLFARNENEKLPLASITKIMTALIAREKVSASAVVILTKDDLASEGDTGLRPGERWRVGDLLNVMLLISSNDAAHAVAGFIGNAGQPISNGDEARAKFITMMNEKARTLGLSQTEFFNESGLDISETQNGGYGSARDVAILFSELWRDYPETVEITAHKDARIISQDNIPHILPNTNEIIGHIPGLIASKTGYTKLAGGNLAVIFDRGIGDPVVVVVLGSSYKGRFDDMEKLVSVVRESESVSQK